MKKKKHPVYEIMGSYVHKSPLIFDKDGIQQGSIKCGKGLLNIYNMYIIIEYQSLE